MDPEELFPDAQKEESKLGALAPETGKLSRKESLMKSLAESLEASTAASGFAASPLAALAEKNEDAEEAGDDVIGDLPQSLLGRRTVSPDVESLLGPSSLPRSGASGVESLRQSLAASLEASASSVPLSPDTHSSPDADSVDRMQDFGLLKDADSVARLEHLGSRSSSKESESVVSAISRAKSKELLQKGSTASLLQNITGGAGGTRVHRLDREELKRLGQEIKDIHSTYQDKFVGKMDYFSLLSRMARIEEFMEHQLGRGGSVTSVIETLIKESRMHMAENEKLHRQMDELSKATVGNTSRIRDDSHRVENAADHAFRTAKHLEEVSNDFSVTKEVFREDVTRMAKAVQVLANEFRIFEEDNFKSNEKKAEQIGSAGDAIRELQKQIGKQELHGSTMEDGLEVIKQEVNSCAKEAGLKKLERRIMDMQEESARLQEFVHEKFFQIQDQERREMMAAFAARWDPYNRTRLLRKTMDGWVEFLRRQNKSREALARVKQIYAKTHVTARLRSWWYLMQRDHTDTQFKRLSENLETAEAKLEGTRGAVIRHEKATAEQARNLQYRLLAVEKGLETAEKEKATKHEVQEGLDEIDRRLSEELSLDPVRRDLAEMKLHLKKLQEDKLDAAVADADREKVHDFCADFRSWLHRHDESLKRKAEISENDTKADARTIEQVLVLLAKQADQLASMVAYDFEQLRQALTRFLEISPDFRKASLGVGFEPHEQCVACRALPRKCVSDGATGADGAVYKLTMETTISAVEETQKVLTDRLKYPLSLASNSFVELLMGCDLFGFGINLAASRTMWLLLWLDLFVLTKSYVEYVPPEVQGDGGYRHSFELRYDNSVWGTGRNDFGQLGDGSVAHRVTPTKVFRDASQASAGEWHSLFLRNDSVVFACGRNDFGQLGDATRVTRIYPVQITKPMMAVSGGSFHSLLLGTDGFAQATGLNDFGQLGDGSYVSKTRPVMVMGNVSAIAAGGHHSVFLLNDGTAWTTGRNHYGQLGDRTTITRVRPVYVLSDVTTILARDDYSLFLLNNGSLVAAGDFNSGLPRSQTSWNPIQIFSPDQVQQIALDI